jgi:excisionase family DNA binding protein
MEDAPDDDKARHPLEEQFGLLSVTAAGKVLDVSNPTIYRLISHGKLAALRHGGRTWIERAEITDYFARERAEASKRRAERAKARSRRQGRT